MSDITICINDIKTYISNNRKVGIFFILMIILGGSNFLWLSKLDFWKNWEVASFVFTIIYTLYVARMFYKNNIFNDLGGNLSVWLHTITFVGAGFMALVVANDIFNILTIYIHRIAQFWGMAVISFLFAYRNGVLYSHYDTKANAISINTNRKRKILKEKYFELRDSFKNSLFMSELPITISFVILALCSTYYRLIGLDKNIIDPFFSGAVAFQMICSNAVWIFTDDPIIEEN